MFEFLTPKTLAAIVAELEAARHEMILFAAHDLRFLTRAHKALTAAVGTEEATRLIHEATEALP